MEKISAKEIYLFCEDGAKTAHFVVDISPVKDYNYKKSFETIDGEFYCEKFLAGDRENEGLLTGNEEVASFIQYGIHDEPKQLHGKLHKLWVCRCDDKKYLMLNNKVSTMFPELKMFFNVGTGRRKTFSQGCQLGGDYLIDGKDISSKNYYLISLEKMEKFINKRLKTKTELER